MGKRTQPGTLRLVIARSSSPAFRGHPATPQTPPRGIKIRAHWVISISGLSDDHIEALSSLVVSIAFFGEAIAALVFGAIHLFPPSLVLDLVRECAAGSSEWVLLAALLRRWR